MTYGITRSTLGALNPDGFPLVLMYHSVDTYTRDPYLVTVRPARLERQLRWLRRRRLTGVSMGRLVRAGRNGSTRGLVGLTFDDGYTDFVDNALPLLRHYGFTATVFVIGGLLGGYNSWEETGPRKELMSAGQVRRVADSGMEIGSHGLLHRRLSTVPGPELSDETVGSRAVLEEIVDRDVTGFCYPYGDVNAEAVGAVRAAGYEYGCAIRPGPLSGRHALPRTYVGDGDHQLRLDAKRLRHRLVISR